MRKIKTDLDVADAARRLFKTPDGQVVLHHLIETFYILEPCYSKGGSTDHNDGMRVPVLHLMGLANSDVAKSARIATERANENATRTSN